MILLPFLASAAVGFPTDTSLTNPYISLFARYGTPRYQVRRDLRKAGFVQ